MTVSTTSSRVRYTGDGSTTNFPVPYGFIDANDLEVIARTIGDGTETALVLGVDYTVTGGAGGTGTVHAVTAPDASLEWVIGRATARTQETDYTANDPFPAETHERALDRLTMIVQEQDEALGRVPTLPKSSALTSLQLPEPSASTLLAWNGAGDGIVNVAAADVGLAAVSPFALTVLDDGDASAMRATLGLAIGADVLAYDADILKADVSDQLSVGYTVATHDLGNSGTGTVTPDFSDGNFQRITIDGPFTLAAPSGQGILRLEVTNDGTGGRTITFSGFYSVNGSYDDTAAVVQVFEIDTTGARKKLTIRAAEDSV